MFPSPEAKQLSHVLSVHKPQLLEALSAAIREALSGNALERQVLVGLLTEVPERLKALEIPDVEFRCRCKSIHQKPMVTRGAEKSELGDMLVVVKYHLPDYTCIAKSIVYQLKLTERGGSKCRIDNKQLTLLRDWPCFSFGQRRDGKRQEFAIHPGTTEFGSYMLEPRGIVDDYPVIRWVITRSTPSGASVTTHISSSGCCPTAWECLDEGRSSADIGLPQDHVPPDVFAFAAHILFQTGEPHSNHEVYRLISALYRFCRMEPDPPEEFAEYQVSDENDGFLLLEINVHHFPEREAHKPHRTP